MDWKIKIIHQKKSRRVDIQVDKRAEIEAFQARKALRHKGLSWVDIG